MITSNEVRLHRNISLRAHARKLIRNTVLLCCSYYLKKIENLIIYMFLNKTVMYSPCKRDETFYSRQANPEF